MKYRNTSLIGRNCYYLIRENKGKDFETDLENLKNVKPYLASNIKGFNEVYDKRSQNQAYLIYNDKDMKNCLGGIVIIAPLFDNEPIKLKIYIDERKVRVDEEAFKIVNEIIDLLGRCNCSSEQISIEMENDLNLNNWNSSKYQRSPFEWEKSTYLCNNAYHQILPAALEEISSVKQTAQGENVKKLTEQVEIDSSKFSFPIDNAIAREYRKNTIPLLEVFDKADVYRLDTKLADGTITTMNHKYDGTVDFVKKSSNCSYYGEYNLIDNTFSLVDYNDTSYIYSNSEKYYLGNTKSKITHNKEHNLELFEYQSGISATNTSINSQLVIKDGQLKTFYTDLRIHRDSNKKVNGTYMLRWKHQTGLIFTYHNRKGMVEIDLKELLAKEDKELYHKLLNSDIDLEAIDKLLVLVAAIVNRTAYHFEEISLSKEITKLKNTSTDLLEKVSEETYSNYLKNTIKKFIVDLKLAPKESPKKMVKKQEA